MVQEKDAAEKRADILAAFSHRRAKELEENTIRFSWQVVERTPAYFQHNEYNGGDWVQKKDKVVSPSFDTEDEANDWFDRHVPDEGKSLHIRRMRLIRRFTEVWVNY